MADRYPGYWQASDGNWYPDALMPPPPPDAQPAYYGPAPAVAPAKSSSAAVAILSVGVGIIVLLVAILGLASLGGDREERITLTGVPGPVPSTAPVAVVDTTIAPTVAPETAPPETAPPTAPPTTAPPPPPTTVAPTLPPPTAPPATSPPKTAPPPTAPPATFAPVPLVPSGGGCDPNYTPCVPIASDVDCAGGSGNGPAYVSGPVTIIGTDIYGLDGNDNDGIGCEG